MYKHLWIRRIFTLLFFLGLVGTVTLIGTTHPAHAQVRTNADASSAIQYADSYCNCADAACSSTINAGDAQPNFECAEFVARALAAEGLVPRLDSSSPQSNFQRYTASDGNTYNLLWPSSNNSGGGGGGIRGLEDYLLNTGIGTDIGDSPSQAAPGDVVFYYANSNHTSIIVDTSNGPVVDAHNVAEYHIEYTEGGPAYFSGYAGRTIVLIQGNTTNPGS